MKVFNLSSKDIAFDKIIIENNELNENGEETPKTHLHVIVTPESYTEQTLDNPAILSLQKLGSVRRTLSGDLHITIKGQHKILKAIDLCLNEIDRSADEGNNSDLREALVAVSNEISTRIPRRTIPYTNIPYDDLEKGEKLSSPSTHTVKSVKYKGLHGFFKEEPKERAIVDIEGFNSLCLEVLLNERVAISRPVYAADGSRKGVLSIGIPGFKPFNDYKKDEITVEMLLVKQVVKIWTACFCEKENDLHKGNYGLEAKIDHDQTSHPLIEKYLPYYGVPGLSTRNFKVTKEDIKSLPNYKDASPNNGPHWDKDLFHLDELKNNSEYNEQKYFVFLKRILLPDQFYQDAAQISASSPIRAVKLASNKIEGTSELKNELLDLKEFQDYVNKKGPLDIVKIRRELIVFNRRLVQEGLPLQVDLAKFQDNYENMLKNIKLISQVQIIETELENYIESRTNPSFRKFFRNPELTDDKIVLAKRYLKELEINKKGIVSCDSDDQRKYYEEMVSEILQNLPSEDQQLEERYGKRRLSFTRSDLSSVATNLSKKLDLDVTRKDDAESPSASRRF